jgi:hypothetical protein
MEAYIDDVVIKTKDKSYLIFELVETFKSLRNFSIKMNTNKCTFGMSSRKLLGVPRLIEELNLI